MVICARICLGVGSRWCECGGMWWYFLFVLRVCCGTSVFFTREGWGGGGGGDAPCIPVRGHVITHRYAIVHTCTVQFSRPPLCHAHCHLIPCGTHAFTTAFRHSQCTLACTECNARMASSSFAPTNCLSSALHGDSTSPSLHFLHPANVGCTHSRAPYQLHAPLMFENMCAPPHHKALPCQQSHGLTPTSPTHPHFFLPTHVGM